jgi:hypothetical protein
MLFFLSVAGLGSEDEVRLVDTLFHTQGYNPLIRPVRNLTEVVTVKFGLAMIQLINVVSFSCCMPVKSTFVVPFFSTGSNYCLVVRQRNNLASREHLICNLKISTVN